MNIITDAGDSFKVSDAKGRPETVSGSVKGGISVPRGIIFEGVLAIEY
jgi:hypothetical protein